MNMEPPPSLSRRHHLVSPSPSLVFEDPRVFKTNWGLDRGYLLVLICLIAVNDRFKEMRGMRSQPRGSEEWQEVNYNRKKENVREDKGQGSVNVTKFFVSNIPEKASPTELQETLKGFGHITGVYIARKLDKFGNRFGFVSFKKDRDIQDLIFELKNVKMGQHTLFISLARFVDGKVLTNMDERRRPGTDRQKEKIQEVDISMSKSEEPLKVKKVDSGLSFKDRLLNKENNEILKNQDTINIDDNVQAFSHWHEVAVVGRVRGFNVLKGLRSLLKKENLEGGRIKYLGGLSVMLVFRDSEKVQDFMNQKEVWDKWFESMDLWKGQVLAYERIAWLKVQGVPFHLFLDSVFNVIGKWFGKVIQPAQITDDDGDLTFIVLGVLVGDCLRIKEELKLRWRNKSVRIWIEEEMGEWTPDCLDEDDDYEDVIVEKEEGEILSCENPVTLAANQTENMEPIIEEIVEERIELNEIDSNSTHGDSLHDCRNSFSVDLSHKEKKKGCPKIRKNGRPKSVSPQVQARPRKRQRNDDDPFDLDRFIGCFPVNPITEVGPSNLTRENDEVFQTPDLNNRIGTEEEIGVIHVENVEEGPEMINDIQVETEETIRLGVALGVEGLEEFAQLVTDTIQAEGFQQTKNVEGEKWADLFTPDTF